MKQTNKWKNKAVTKQIENDADDPFESMTLEELEAQQEVLQRALANKRETQRMQVIQAIQGLLDKSHFTLEELFPQRVKPRRTGRITHRNPSDASQTWSGTGRRPQWLQDMIAKGYDADDFRVRTPRNDGDSASV